MKSIHKLFALYAVVLALGLGLGLPQKHAQELEASASSAVEPQEQSPLAWALQGELPGISAMSDK